MLKIVHGNGLTHPKPLDTLLYEPKFEMTSYETGTFSELLRHGIIHFEQLRDDIRIIVTDCWTDFWACLILFYIHGRPLVSYIILSQTPRTFYAGISFPPGLQPDF